MSEEKKDEYRKGELTPVRDAAGNFLAIGSDIIFTGHSKLNVLRGRVVGFNPGGIVAVVDINSKDRPQTPPRIELQFSFTINFDPRLPLYAAEIFRIVNPDLESLIEKAMLSDKKN